MHKDTYLSAELMSVGEIAFGMSAYAKHGDSGRERFLRGWLKSFKKTKKGKFFCKAIEQRLLGIKDDVTLVNVWLNSLREFGDLKAYVANYKDHSDLERIKEVFNLMADDFTNKLAISNEEHEALSISGDNQFWIKATDIKKLVNGSIPTNESITLYISHESEEYIEEIQSVLLNLGFSICEFDERLKFTSYELESAHNCEYVKCLDGRLTS